MDDIVQPEEPQVEIEGTEEEKPKRYRSKTITVRVLNPAAYAGRDFVVVQKLGTISTAGYMIPKSELPQEIRAGNLVLKESVVDAAPLAYDFLDVLEKLIPNIFQVSEALWEAGVTSTDDVKPEVIRRVLNRVLPDAYDFCKLVK